MKVYKLALLAALGLAGVAAAHAQSTTTYNSGDLLVGIYQPGEPNTTVVDIGDALTISGETFQQWDLSTALTAAGLPSTLGASAVYGLIGYDNSAANNVYLTAAHNHTPPATGPFFSTTSNDIDNLGINGLGTQAVGPIGQSNQGANAIDWYSQTINFGANGGGVGADVQVNVNNTVGTAEILYKAPSGNITPTHLLNFDLTPAGLLTYGSVPEPSTYTLLLGGGLLAFSRRNLFRAKSVKQP